MRLRYVAWNRDAGRTLHPYSGKGWLMSESTKDKHEQALDLTEQALEALDKGDEGQADQLIEKAKKLDPTAPEEIVEDLKEG